MPKSPTSRVFTARSMSAAGLPNFTVVGGPLAAPQSAGWHITDDRGMTVGVVNSQDAAQRLAAGGEAGDTRVSNGRTLGWTPLFCSMCGRQDVWQDIAGGSDYYTDYSAECRSCGNQMMCIDRNYAREAQAEASVPYAGEPGAPLE